MRLLGEYRDRQALGGKGRRAKPTGRLSLWRRPGGGDLSRSPRPAPPLSTPTTMARYLTKKHFLYSPRLFPRSLFCCQGAWDPDQGSPYAAMRSFFPNSPSCLFFLCSPHTLLFTSLHPLNASLQVDIRDPFRSKLLLLLFGILDPNWTHYFLL